MFVNGLDREVTGTWCRSAAILAADRLRFESQLPIPILKIDDALQR